MTDFACAGFPIIILRKLQVNRRLKFALWGIMGLGILLVTPVINLKASSTHPGRLGLQSAVLSKSSTWVIWRKATLRVLEPF